MSIVVTKGNSFSGQYTQAVIATATDWTGTASVYSNYPGTAIFSVDLELSGDGTKLLFTLPSDQILNLDAGSYSVVGNIKSTTLGIDTYRIDYMTVTDVIVSEQPMTKLFMTISKRDGTPPGAATKTLQNYQPPNYQDENGVTVISYATVTVVNVWKGVSVIATYPVAETIDGTIWGVGKTETETNASGYAELFVLKGSVPTVSCPAFGKSVTVDTTGLDTIDLSTFF